MVAELLTETEQPQPDAEAQSDPNPAAEPVTAPESEASDETSYDDILTGLLADPATATGDGEAAPANETGPPEKALTPEEIREQTRRELEAENAKKQTDYQRQQQLAGIRRSFASLDDDLDKILSEELGVTDLAQIKRVKSRVQQHNGHWNELYQNDVQTAQQAAITAMREALIEEGVKRTGNKEFAATAIPEYVDTLVAHEIKAKGYKTAAEVKEERKAAQLDLLKRLREMGVELPTERVPNVPAARSGGGPGPSSLAAYNSATMEQRAAWDKADPNLLSRLVEQAQRRGG